MLARYPAPPVSRRAVAASVTSVVGFEQLYCAGDRRLFVGAAGGEHPDRGGAHRFDGDGHHPLVQGMLDDPAFAVEDVAQHFADPAIFAQRLAVGLADQRKARDRRFGSERADADHHRVERLQAKS